MAREKEFSTLDRQVEIQQARNLKISDVKKTKKNFATKNYFNMINGFETLILEDQNLNKMYSNGKNIKDFYRAYQLDKKISEQLFLQIANVETELKTRIAYFFCTKYCQNGVSDNLKYEDIGCYTIPSSSNGKPKYTSYFYNTRTNRTTRRIEIDSKKTHKLFSKHGISIHTHQLRFVGDVSQDNSKPNMYYLKGVFYGTIKGLKTNEFKGTLSIDLNQNRGLSLTPGTNLTVNLSNVSGRFLSLSYSDFCKIKYPYISSYKKPPFWVIIHTLMLNDLIVLFHGLDNDIQKNIVTKMGNFDINNAGKEEFICALEILIDLRNLTAHYGLVTRYRTPSNLSIVNTLLQRLSLKPKSNDKVIRFYDVIKTLSLFHSFSNLKIRKKMIYYINFNRLLLKNDINTRFYKRIGAQRVLPWLQMKDS
ncbi:Abi family protein [Enterococcus sp. LJL98]